MIERIEHVGYQVRDSEHTTGKNQSEKIVKVDINCQHMK
jgi:hypothetical protein